MYKCKFILELFNLSSLNACIQNLSFTNTLTNVNTTTFHYISDLTDFAHKQMNNINFSIVNVCTVVDKVSS